MYRLLFVSLLVLFTRQPMADSNVAIHVRITGLKPSVGLVRIGLYRQGENWLQFEKAYRGNVVPVEESIVESSFQVEPGEYGIAVFHDENENGKLDMRWLPWPKPEEGAGISNNIQRNGPPRYEDARFVYLQQAMSLEIEINYY